MSYLTGLIGDPVSHSRSPLLHTAAFAYYGIDGRYELWQTSAAELPQRVETLRARDVLGANVTLPHKIAVMPLLDRVDPAAKLVGAVNTIRREADGSLSGYNTDVAGFLDALHEDANFDPTGQHALILGASGAARAAATALIGGGVASLVVVNRTLERAESLLADMLAAQDEPGSLPEASPEVRLLALGTDDASVADYLAASSLIVNATSIGWHGDETPLAAESIPAGVVVYDMVYRPTRLLADARLRGAHAYDGLGMLVRQAALAFALWTGRPAPVDVMRAAVIG